MNEETINQLIKSGGAEIIQSISAQQDPTQAPPETPTEFMYFLSQMKTRKETLKIPPVFKPMTFYDQIQFLDDGTTQAIYVYSNNTWKVFSTNANPVAVFNGGLGAELSGLKTISKVFVTGSITYSSNRLTVTEAGKYFVHAQQLITIPAAPIYLYIRKNGVAQVYGYLANSTTTDIIAECVLDLVVGDYVDFFYSAGPAVTVWTAQHTNVNMFKIGGMKGDKGEVGLTGGLDGPTPYIHLGMSAAQTVDVGTVINFDTVLSSNELTKFANGIALKAGKTYKLSAYLNVDATATGNMYMGAMIYFETTAISKGFYANTPGSPANHGMHAPGITYYTPSVDGTAYVKVIDDNIGTGTVNGSWSTAFIAEQIVGMKGDPGPTGPTGGLDGPTPYIHLGLTVDQTVDNGTTVAFDRVKSVNGLTRNGFGVEVKAGKTYRLQAYLDIGAVIAPGYLGYTFYDGTTALGTGDDWGYSRTSVDTISRDMKAPAFLFYTPVTDGIVYVKIVNDGVGTGYVESQWNTSFIVEQVVGMKGEKGDKGEVGLTGGLDGPTPYVHYGMSAQQTVDNGTAISFDTVRSSNGMTVSGNGIVLKAGKTYKLKAWINHISATGNQYVGCKFYDGVNPIGESFYSVAAPTSTLVYGFSAPGFMFYTPVADTIVYVKVLSDQLGTGFVHFDWNTSFIAEQVVGMKGDKGDKGNDGSNGTNGANGTNGVNGLDGKNAVVFRTGAGVPNNVLGVDNEYYLNTLTSDVYYKAGGSWSVVANIKGGIGPQGNPGTNGTNGTNGINSVVFRNGSGVPAGGLGLDTEYYLNNLTGDIYYKTAGTWNIIINIKEVTLATAQTFTNKRVQPRVYNVASIATLTPEIDTYDIFELTAQAAALTIANYTTSTPAPGEKIMIRITDNGTARAISFGSKYRALGVALPTTTTIYKTMYLGFIWNATITKWDLIALMQE